MGLDRRRGRLYQRAPHPVVEARVLLEELHLAALRDGEPNLIEDDYPGRSR